MSYQDICSFLPPDETLVAVGRLLQLGEATLFVKMRGRRYSAARQRADHAL
jgi:hypothetical protein